MSFGGFGGGGGFGQQNTTNTGGFGGFGANNNNTTSAFGTSPAPAFGAPAQNTGGGLFGSTTGTGAFGNTGGGFGATNNAFGAKPAFGAPATTAAGTGIFGSTTAPATGTGFGGGGFGANNAAPSTGFGFGGASKPAFGTNATTGSGSMSMGGSSTFGGSTVFGSTNNTQTGFGAAAALPDPPGTAGTPFAALQEKEGTSNITNAFQNLLFQEPYKRYSAEELRLADYNQGRQFGNGATGQAGAFGSAGFGGNTTGFGNTAGQTTNAFGAAATGNNLFGGGQQTTTGFGNNTTNTSSPFGGGGAAGGLFGQKPAGTGLFGGGNNTAQPAQTGGLFGSTTNNNTGFGNTATSAFGNANTANTGAGGLFGNTQNKPATGFGGFGGNTTATNTGFGNTATNTGFGNTGAANPTGGLFGSQPQNTNTGGLFGQNNTQQAQTTGFGGTTAFGQNNQQQQQPQQQAGGLFGNQAKPAGGLFGSTTTTQPAAGAGGGLFGANNASNAFGQNNNQQQQQAGGIFGQAPKPATTGLFGQPNTQQTGQTGGGGLFGSLGGNTQNAQQNTGSLFGAQAQQKPSLFGASTQPTAGTSMFGQPQQQQTGSLFGGTATAQPQQPSLLGNSLFNTSQNAQSTPQSLTASISDVNAYGTPSLFAGLGNNDIQNPGPLATPLSSKNKQPRKNTILPMWKLNPGSGSKMTTPVKRGFGFSYSTYGSPATPSSAGSTSSIFGQSLLGSGNLSRSLNKSYSASNLRKTINADDSILSPGSFSASMGPRAYGSGRFNKLTVDRSLRVDLFSPLSKEKQIADSPIGPRKLPKRVSFDTSNADNGSPATIDSPDTPTAAGDAAFNRMTNGSSAAVNGSSSRSPEMEQVRGNELAVVQEESSPVSSSVAATGSATAKGPGEYWMRPTKEEIEKMNRVQKSQFTDFTVGRHNVGQVCFKGPVDLTSINLDDVPGNIVVLETRSCTVYPDSMKKPAMGKGLNVPSEISLLQSWPRNVDRKTGQPVKSGRALEKHINRLKNNQETNFISYEPETGTWTFSVEHFTTYGLDYDDDDTDGETVGDITMDEAPSPIQSPQNKHQIPYPTDVEDDFEIRRKRRALPGAFDYTGPVSDDEEDTADANKQSFLSSRSVGSTSQALVPHQDKEMDVEHALPEAQDARPYLGYHQAAEPGFDSPPYGSMAEYQEVPAGIMRARMQAIKGANTPLKIEVADGDDWTHMLRKTIAPRKRDRAALKLINEEQSYESLKESTMNRASPAKLKPVSDNRGFATSIELMNSLFEKPKVSARTAGPTILTQGFKMPHKTHHKKSQDEETDLDPSDRAWYDTLRPSWGPDGTLVLATGTQGLLRSSKKGIEKVGIMSMKRLKVSENCDVRLAKLANESSAKAISNQISMTRFKVVNNVPSVTLALDGPLTALFHGEDLQNPANAHEKMVWELAGILFDRVTDAEGASAPAAGLRQARRQKLSAFWESAVEESSSRDMALVRSAEDKAVAALSGHRIPEACTHLIDGKDFRLATMVALIGTSDRLMEDIKEQLREWRDANVLSEFSDPIRTIYELLSGNVCAVEGKKGSMENRMSSFVISDKFGMDWKRSFGLRLWYGNTSPNDVVEAIHAYEEDIKQDKEKSPKPWFAEQGIPPLWDDSEKEKRADLLWGLLKLYANNNTDLVDVLRPENSRLSPFDYRLCWQLGQALLATGQVTFGQNANDKADAATLAFASQLTSEGNWLEAVFVLLHLTNPTVRAKAIQEHLARHGRLIGNEQSEDFITLTQTFRIPSPWVWQAKALYVRAVGKDRKAEVIYLLRATSYSEAHKTFTKQVAPLAIIERDYEGLWEMLTQFQGAEESIADWNLGGKVYADFLELVQHSKPAEVPQAVVKSLCAGLSALHDSVQVRGDVDVQEAAAVADMANITAKVVMELAKKGETSLSKVLSLPLTEDAYLKYSNELAFAYYRDVMVGH